MSRQSKYYIGIEVDKLTNSILNTISGANFETVVNPLAKEDLKRDIIEKWMEI
ncbi:flagellar basal body-associated protein FliL [Chitinophaga sp. W3I9]